MLEDYFGKLFNYKEDDILFLVIGETKRNSGSITIFRIDDSKYVDIHKVAFLKWLKDDLIEEIK